MSDETQTLKSGKQEWNEVRLGFYNSIMVDSPLNSLSQNAELGDWPIKREGETPAKYVDFTWEEIHELPGLADHPERVELLIAILKETLAFDDPFGDMVTTVETATDSDQSLERNLKELEIPLDCPLKFSAFTRDTLSFCAGEGAATVGEFASFSERMAQNILVGGDFKELLNALIMKDELEIARYLPFRPNAKGLHLIEAIGIACGKLRERDRYTLLKKYGRRLSKEQASLADQDPKRVTEIERQIQTEVKELADYFKNDTIEIQDRLASGTSLERCFIALDDEGLEALGSAALEAVFSDRSVANRQKRKTPRRGFFAWLFRKS